MIYRKVEEFRCIFESKYCQTIKNLPKTYYVNCTYYLHKLSKNIKIPSDIHEQS